MHLFHAPKISKIYIKDREIGVFEGALISKLERLFDQ